MRFKSVRKSWYALIQHNWDFARTHYANSQTRPESSSHLLFSVDSIHEAIFPASNPVVDGDGVVFSTQLPTHHFQDHKNYGFPVTNIVNGLICVLPWYRFRLELLNLTTMEKRALPRKSYSPGSIFSPCYLGFDPVSNHYKVLLFCIRKRKFFVITLIKSSTDDTMPPTWREVASSPRFGITEFNPLAMLNSNVYTVVYADGAIYWTKKRDNEWADEEELKFFSPGGERVLQYFDFADELFKLLKLPKHAPEFDSEIMTEVGGNFTWAGWVKDHDDGVYGEITLWMLTNKRDDTWVKSIIELPKHHFCRELSIVGTGGEKILITSSISRRKNPWRYLEVDSRDDEADVLIFCDLGEKDNEKKKYEIKQLRGLKAGTKKKIPKFLLDKVQSVDISYYVENILPLSLLLPELPNDESSLKDLWDNLYI
ncbi:OLC1v1003714C1 [Oldenlandia corymbosa var. corymbosa]|uniref:OLC1v1003714C1 n=1 Tax=Oldenlandia corymbosa var. corymbosa TaxID=529605 RepID=A0AAV1DDD9_OLDCO|nr:OLC1v1003714C1 [Oldenlandia corymbosa var. corymbosa]